MGQELSAKNLNPSSFSAQAILEEIDRAIGDHMNWLADWHRTLLCREAPPPNDLAYDSHHLCGFGSWHLKHQHKGLVNQPALRNLAKLHGDMHDRAASLMAKAKGGAPLPRQDYEAFMRLFNSFIARSRRLEGAFSQASSDLDPLTGLHNRQAMVRDLDREHGRMERTARPSCIALADIDHFKKINDTYGHLSGDQVLVASSSCFLAHLRPYDALYRYGGEEFLFCLPDTGMAEAINVLERLRAELAACSIKLEDGKSINVTSSFGVAEMLPGTGVDKTIESADQALYCAKKQGRNRVCGQ